MSTQPTFAAQLTATEVELINHYRAVRDDIINQSPDDEPFTTITNDAFVGIGSIFSLLVDGLPFGDVRFIIENLPDCMELSATIAPIPESVLAPFVEAPATHSNRIRAIAKLLEGLDLRSASAVMSKVNAICEGAAPFSASRQLNSGQ